ncbi:D-2-hydroxyacid dehydrogenase [Brevibacterium litoralis]|uniref:D-2-hydroxyacid dehydrogenase n=1 Tax=Brevibacterium litoralis TaxID=3138935 RepID=UPI0032F05DA3
MTASPHAPQVAAATDDHGPGRAPVTDRVLTVVHGEGKAVPESFGRLADTAAEVRYVTSEGLARALPGTHAVLMWDFQSTALRDAFDRADRLEWVHAASAGVDRIVFPALRDSGVTLTNARGTFDRPIAEFVLSFLLMFAKDMPRSLVDQAGRVWRHRETEDLTGTRVMVAGTGAIGREIARLLRAVGLEVRGAGSYARTGDPDFGDIVDSADLAAHVTDVDWLVNVAPLTPATTGYIGRSVFDALPAHARFVNVGRGDSVVTADLVAALESGSIAGAGLDVVDTEPMPAEHPLWSTPNTLITPHMSGDTQGWSERLAVQFLENWDRYVAGEPLHNVIDLEKGYARA